MRRRISCASRSSNIAHEKMYAQDIFGILQNQQLKITQLLDKAKQEQYASEILSEEQQQQVGVSQQLLKELSSYECSAERINSILQKRMTSLQKLRQQRVLSEDACQRQSMQLRKQQQYVYPQWYETQLNQQELNQQVRTSIGQSVVGRRSSCDISDLSSILEQHRINQMFPQENTSNMISMLPHNQQYNKNSPYLPNRSSILKKQSQQSAKKNISNLKQRRNNLTGNARQYYYNIDIVSTNSDNHQNTLNKNNNNIASNQNNNNLIQIIANDNVELSQVTQKDNHLPTQEDIKNDSENNHLKEEKVATSNEEEQVSKRNESLIEEQISQNTNNSLNQSNQPLVSQTERNTTIKNNQQIDINIAQQKQPRSTSEVNLNQNNHSNKIVGPTISATARVESRTNHSDKEHKRNNREIQIKTISNNHNQLLEDSEDQIRQDNKKDNTNNEGLDRKLITQEIVLSHDQIIKNSNCSFQNEGKTQFDDDNNNKGDLKIADQIKQASSLQIQKESDVIVSDQQTLRQSKRMRAYSALESLNSKATPLKKASSIYSIDKNNDHEIRSKLVKSNLSNQNQTDLEGCFETDQEMQNKNSKGILKMKDRKKSSKQQDNQGKVENKIIGDETNSIQRIQIDLLNKISNNNKPSTQQQENTQNSIQNITFQDQKYPFSSISNSSDQQKSSDSISNNDPTTSFKGNEQNADLNNQETAAENKTNSILQQSTYPSNSNLGNIINNSNVAIPVGGGHTFIDKQEVNIILPVDMPVFQIDQFLRFFPQLDTQINQIKQANINIKMIDNVTNQINKDQDIPSDSISQLLLKTQQDSKPSNNLEDHCLERQDNQCQDQQSSSCQSLLILKEQTQSKANIQSINRQSISRHNYCLNSIKGINVLNDNSNISNNDVNQVINKCHKDQNCSLRSSVNCGRSNAISNRNPRQLIAKNEILQDPAVSVDSTNIVPKLASDNNRTQQVTASFNTQLPSSSFQNSTSVSFTQSSNQRGYCFNNVNTHSSNAPCEKHLTPLKYPQHKFDPQLEQSNPFLPIQNHIHNQNSLHFKYPDYSQFIPQPSDTCTVFSRRSNSFDVNNDNIIPNHKSSNPKIQSRFRQFLQKEDENSNGSNNNNKIRNVNNLTYKKNQRYDRSDTQQFKTSANINSKNATIAKKAQKGTLNQSYHNRRYKNTNNDLVCSNIMNSSYQAKDLCFDEENYQQSPGSFKFELTSRTGEASICKQTSSQQNDNHSNDLDQNDYSNSMPQEDNSKNGRKSKFIGEDSGSNCQNARDQQQQLVDPTKFINRFSMYPDQSLPSCGSDKPSQSHLNSNQLNSFQLSPRKIEQQQTEFNRIKQLQLKQSEKKDQPFEFTSPAVSTNAFDLNNSLNQKQFQEIRKQPPPRFPTVFKEDFLIDQINPSASENKKQAASGIYQQYYSQRQNSQNCSVENNLEERGQIKYNLIEIQKQSTQLNQALPQVSKIFEFSNQNIQKDKCQQASIPNSKPHWVNYNNCDSNQVLNQEQQLSRKPTSNNSNNNYNSQYCCESIPPPQIGSDQPDDPTTRKIPSFIEKKSFIYQERNGNNLSETSRNKNTTNLSEISQNQDISSLTDQLQLQFFKNIDPTNSTFCGSVCYQYKEQLKTSINNGLVNLDQDIFRHYQKIIAAETNGINDIIKHSDQEVISNSTEDQTRERKYFSVLEQRMTYQIEANLLFLEKSLQCSKSSTKEELLEKLKEFRLEIVSTCEQQDKSIADLKVRHHHLLDSFELPSQHIIGNFSF